MGGGASLSHTLVRPCSCLCIGHNTRIRNKSVIFHLEQLQLTVERESGLDVSGPKHGQVDETGNPHVGGNTWAGGTGGRDTAGLGGKGGPYRLDAGHTVHQVSEIISRVLITRRS